MLVLRIPVSVDSEAAIAQPFVLVMAVVAIGAATLQQDSGFQSHAAGCACPVKFSAWPISGICPGIRSIPPYEHQFV